MAGGTPLHPAALNWLGGCTSEPDKAEKGKVFGIDFKMTEGKLAPDPRSISTAKAQHLVDQFLDFCAQPNTIESIMSETAKNNATLSQALTSLAGVASDLVYGSAPADHQWKNIQCITFCDLKNHHMVEDHLKDLQDGQYLV